MKKIFMFLFALFLLAGCSNDNKEAFKSAMVKGKEAIISEEYEKALAYFESALDESNDDEEAKALVVQTEKMIEAIELQESEEYDDALALFEEVGAMNGGYERLSEQARKQGEALVALMEEQETREDEATISTEEQDFREKNSGTFVDTNDEVVIVLEISSDNTLYGSFSRIDSDSATPISFVTQVTSKGSTDTFELYVGGELTEGGMSINFEGSKIILTAMSGIDYQEVYEFNL